MGARLERKGGGRKMRLCAGGRLETAPLSEAETIHAWSFRNATPIIYWGFWVKLNDVTHHAEYWHYGSY